jgi:hypothetical protein
MISKNMATYRQKLVGLCILFSLIVICIAYLMASARNPYITQIKINENFTSHTSSEKKPSQFTSEDKDFLDKSIDLADDILKNLENKRIHIEPPKSHRKMEESLMQMQKSIGDIMGRFTGTHIEKIIKSMHIPRNINDIKRIKLPSEKITTEETNAD